MTDGIAGANVGSVGWIGTGRMGAAMVTRLATAGVSVTVWNRTRSKAEPLAELGCVIADSIASLRGCDIVFTMVSTPADLDRRVSAYLDENPEARWDEAVAAEVDTEGAP